MSTTTPTPTPASWEGEVHPPGDAWPPGPQSQAEPSPAARDPWTPGPEPTPRRRRRLPLPLLRATAWLLVAAVAIAALVTAVTRSGTSSGSPTSAPLSVNTSRLPAGAQGTVAAVAQALIPSVATIVAHSGLGGGGTALGSGFVISNSGGTSYLLTNNHVVSGASTLQAVTSNGRTYQATLVGTDSVDDLAVVSVQDGHLPQVTFGSSSALTSGQAVVAIGSPLGNQNSVTSGVISALHRSITAGSQQTGASERLSDVLQTDASINAGNSGGPLVDLAGRVIGVNVATSSGGTNVSFSIPSDQAQIVAQDLINHRTVEHPYLGIGSVTALDAAEQGRSFAGPGVEVTTVASGSAAEAAGLKTGDVIVGIDGTTLDGTHTLAGLVTAHHVGDTIHLTVQRGGQTLTLTATLQARPNGS
ncbi:MAG: PDZ domain-containing protein [Chloroflexi bacterium]|nr:MAG: PDZ domain-containing protein [Chloroflexota bacterium]